MKLRRGFTLVEVVVVIAIIGVLTVIAFPAINNIRAKNRDAERIADIATLQLGLSLYYNQNQTGPNAGYPVGLNQLYPTYVPQDATIDPKGQQYLYVPLKRTGSTKCTYYQLGTLLELPSTQIDTTNTFSTLKSGTQPNPDLDNGYIYCGTYTGPGIDGVYDQNSNRMYSVHP